MVATTKIEIFFSYAHTDEAWQKHLEKHLGGLKRQNRIIAWYDRNIPPGAEWASEINAHLKTAHIILLLISPDFIDSQYCWSVELRKAIKRHNAGEACVIPIIVRPADWKKTPFAKLQALPTDGKPISTWSNIDEALLNVVEGIRKAVEVQREKSVTTLSKPTVQAPRVPKKGATSVQRWNVPFPRNPFFTGRKDILEHIHTLLSTRNAAFISQPPAISGLGGIGKTQTAVEYAYRYQQEYQYVLWLQANTQETLISDIVTLADLLALPEKEATDQSRTIEAVKCWFEEHTNWLLIVDNADDLPMTDIFLPRTGSGQILLTTRSHSMSGRAQRVDVEAMGTDEGVLFLLRRAALMPPGGVLTSIEDAVRAQAAAIVQTLGGLPLALDQAGAYIEETGCSLSRYLELYQARRKALHQRRSKHPTEHPEPVATTWSLSFQKVEQANPAAAELLRFCAFLSPDAIPEELITEGAHHLSLLLQSLASDPMKLDEAVGELLNYSLIRRNAETTTLSIHRLVQAVLLDEMNQETQKQWDEQVVRVVSELFPLGTAETWPLCRTYLPHALLCVTYIQQWGMSSEEAADLLNNTASYLDDDAQYPEAEPLYQRALSIYERVLGEEHPDTAQSLNNLAILYDKQGKDVEAEPLYQHALAIRERMLGAEHPDTASSLNNLAILYKNQGKYEEAEPLYQRALAIRERMLGAEHPDTAGSLNNLAGLYHKQGKYEEAEPLYQRALAIFERKLGAELPNTATSLNNLALLYADQGKYEEAEPLYQRALAIREHKLGAEHPDTAQSLNNLAALYADQGKYEEAEPLYQRALAIREHKLGAEHPDTASSLNNLAILYKNQGKYEEAEPLYQRALAIRERVLGEEHPDTASSLNNLAILYKNQGKYEEAEPLYQRALAIRERMLGEEHSDTASSLNNLAALYADQGKYEEAEPLYQRALAIREHKLGAEHPDTASSLNNLAILYKNQGKYEEAEPLYQRALSIYERVLGEEHPDTASSLNNLAILYKNQGKYEEAEPLYQRALAIREHKLGEEHPDTASSLNNLANLYRDQGKYEEAEPLYQRALAIREHKLGAEHPDTAQSLNNLAALYRDQGKYEEAEPLYQRALAIREHKLGAEHPDTKRVREIYNELLQKMNRE